MDLAPLREAIVWMAAEGMGVLDDSQQAVVDAFNNLPGVDPIDPHEEDEEDEEDEG